MKKIVTLMVLALALSATACTKKQEEAAAPEGTQVEGTTSTPAEGSDSAPAGEMEEEKKEEAPAATAAE